VGNPISPGFGQKFQKEALYEGKGRFPLRLELFYQSSALTPGARLGAQWRHSYDRKIGTFSSTPSAPPRIAYVYRPDGQVRTFTLTNGQWSTDADIIDKLIRLTDATNTPTGWQYTTTDDEVEIYDVAGKLTSIRNRAGLTQTLAYSHATTPPAVAPTAGLLLSVTDSFGRALSLTYDASSRVKTFTDPGGGIYLCRYDANNNLISVTYPDTKTRSYHYNEPAYTSATHLPHALTGITDENGKRFATFQFDSQGRATSTEHAGGVEKYRVSYGAAYTQSTVTDPMGAISTYSFNTIQGVVKAARVTQPHGTGVVSQSITYDAQGNVDSRTDFNGYKTCYAYDLTRNLELARVEGLAGGASCATALSAATLPSPARKVTTEWHATYRLPTKQAEPKRLTLLTYDAAGNLLTRRVQATDDATGAQGLDARGVGTPRTWRYTYNAFGQLSSITEPGERVTTYVHDASGNLVKVTNAAGHVTTLSNYDAHGQVGTVTEANGVTTTLSYSPRGWLTQSTVTALDGSAAETTRYSYDGTGQLKTVTMPDTSTLTYNHDDAHRLTSITDSLGNRIAYTLDAMGNRTQEQVKDPSGLLWRQTTRVYDSLNRLKELTGATP
jgi:YD repeat-containing protein